jgi:hypothetical protein
METDSAIIFSSAIFLLTNLGVTEYIRSYVENNMNIPFFSTIIKKNSENTNQNTNQNTNENDNKNKM